jgi:hypothetical protein
MERLHINERGTHTTAIEGAREVLKALRKVGAEVSPGIIEGNVGAHGKSVKLKRLGAEAFEMVVVVNGAKQTFKIYGKDQDGIEGAVRGLAAEGWHVPATLDISEAL